MVRGRVEQFCGARCEEFCMVSELAPAPPAFESERSSQPPHLLEAISMLTASRSWAKLRQQHVQSAMKAKKGSLLRAAVHFHAFSSSRSETETCHSSCNAGISFANCPSSVLEH